MFEIGNTLREARVRRNLTLQQVEEDTKIRVKYVQAMENEDWDVMPGVDVRQGLPAHLLHVSRPRSRGHHRRVPLARHGPVGGAPRALRRRLGHRQAAQPPRAATPSSSWPSSASSCSAAIYVARHANGGARATSPHQARGPRHRPARRRRPARRPSRQPARRRPGWQKNLVKLEAPSGDCWMEVRRSDGHRHRAVLRHAAQGRQASSTGKDIWMQPGHPAACACDVEGQEGRAQRATRSRGRSRSSRDGHQGSRRQG